MDTDSMKKQRKNAYVLVDAACTLPVFILTLCLLLSLINQAGYEDAMYADLAEKANASAAALSLTGSGGLDYLPMPGVTRNHVAGCILYRPFWGEARLRCMGDSTVYVFPKRGIRYHILGCSVMQEGSVERILNKQLRKHYSACRICKPDSLPNGAAVYFFTESSSVYHRKTCASVTKTYVEMGLEEAIRGGYTPCNLCLKGVKP